MKNQWKALVFAVPTLGLLALNLQIASAHNWWYWHWHKSSIGVSISNYTTAAQSAIADWDNNSDVSLPIQSTHTDISVMGGDYGATGWWGLASVETAGYDDPSHCGNTSDVCRFVHAHARYNSYYGGTTGGGTNSDVRGVLCQEIGHALGLDHSSTGDCMGKGYYNNINVVGSHNRQDINARY